MHGLGQYLYGFSNTAHVVSSARPEDQSIEEAGFTERFGYEPISRYDEAYCARGDLAGARAHIEEIASAASEELSVAMDRCRSIGYEPSPTHREWLQAH